MKNCRCRAAKNYWSKKNKSKKRLGIGSRRDMEINNDKGANKINFGLYPWFELFSSGLLMQLRFKSRRFGTSRNPLNFKTTLHSQGNRKHAEFERKHELKALLPAERTTSSWPGVISFGSFSAASRSRRFDDASQRFNFSSTWVLFCGLLDLVL